MLVCIFIETTLPYLQAVSEHGEVLPPGDSVNGSILIPFGFPYGTTQAFQIYVSASLIPKPLHTPWSTYFLRGVACMAGNEAM